MKIKLKHVQFEITEEAYARETAKFPKAEPKRLLRDMVLRGETIEGVSNVAIETAKLGYMDRCAMKGISAWDAIGVTQEMAKGQPLSDASKDALRKLGKDATVEKIITDREDRDMNWRGE